jgi:ribosomal protein S12
MKLFWPITVKVKGSQAIEHHVIEHQAIDHQAIERQAIERQATERHVIDHQAIEPKEPKQNSRKSAKVTFSIGKRNLSFINNYII